MMRSYPESAVMHGCRGGRMKGAGFMDFIRKVGGFFKRTKLLSRVGGLASLAFPMLKGPAAVAGILGYGRRRRMGRGRMRRRCR